MSIFICKKNNYITHNDFSKYETQLNTDNLSSYISKKYSSNDYDNDDDDLYVHKIFEDPFLYFAAVNAKFFKYYNILNNNFDKGEDKKPHSSSLQLMLPHLPTMMTAFTIPYRSIVFNKNYKLDKSDIAAYSGTNDNTDNPPNTSTSSSLIIPPATVTINCTTRPPVASVVLYGYQQNVRDDQTEMLMCDCRDHRQLLNIPVPISSDDIVISTSPTPTLTFPFPGLTPVISEPSTTISASGVKHPIIGSTLINRSDNLLLDLNGPCTGLPDGSYSVVERTDDDNQTHNTGAVVTDDASSSILREDLNLYLNTHPVELQNGWKGDDHRNRHGYLVGGNCAPVRIKCVSGTLSNIE